jgi:hypothetical protein
MLVPHFGSSCIRTLRNQRDSQGLLTMIARNFQRILIWIVDIVLFDPEEHPAFRAFPYKHGHNRFSILPNPVKLFNLFIRPTGRNDKFRVSDLEKREFIWKPET